MTTRRPWLSTSKNKTYHRKKLDIEWMLSVQRGPLTKQWNSSTESWNPRLSTSGQVQTAMTWRRRSLMTLSKKDGATLTSTAWSETRTSEEPTSGKRSTRWFQETESSQLRWSSECCVRSSTPETSPRETSSWPVSPTSLTKQRSSRSTVQVSRQSSTVHQTVNLLKSRTTTWVSLTLIRTSRRTRDSLPWNQLTWMSSLRNSEERLNTVSCRVTHSPVTQLSASNWVSSTESTWSQLKTSNRSASLVKRQKKTTKKPKQRLTKTKSYWKSTSSSPKRKLRAQMIDISSSLTVCLIGELAS